MMKDDFMMMYLAYKLELNAIAKTIPDSFDGYVRAADYIFESPAIELCPISTTYGKLVGFMVSELISCDEIRIHDLYVSPSYRGRGYAQMAVADIKTTAEVEKRNISLSIVNRNERAYGFWRMALGTLEPQSSDAISTEYLWRPEMMISEEAKKRIADEDAEDAQFRKSIIKGEGE